VLKTIRRLALIASSGVGLIVLLAPAAHGQQAATATTLPATQMTTTSAVLNGAVSTAGQVAQWNFQWGRTTNYTNATPIQTIPNGQGTVHVSWKLSNLLPNMTYHFRLVAISGIATNYVEIDNGIDQTFTTKPTGKLLLTAKKLTTFGRFVKVPLKCQSKLPCKGKFNINTLKKGRTIGCAAASFGIRAGKKPHPTVTVRPACLALLRAAPHHKIKAKFTARLRTGQQGVPKQIPLILG
jgi:hypothetical protein